jgi:hypothetical protein
MASTTTRVEHDTTPTPVDDGFGAEFRELARQRRFVREAEAATEAGWRSATTPATPSPTASSPAASTAPANPVASTAPATPAGSTAPTARVATAPTAATPARPRVPRTPRISDDAAVMLTELSRMSNRLVESREALAEQRLRADHAEAQLVSANDRLMAARAMVHDAQRATRASAEQAAWLEGRNATLEEALHLAVNSSILTRWRWRRQLRSDSLLDA